MLLYQVEINFIIEENTEYFFLITDYRFEISNIQV